MSSVREILVQGHPLLEAPAAAVNWPDSDLSQEIADLQATLADFRRRSGFGRAIAAPQIGIAKRVVAMNLGATPFALVNPEITWKSDAMFEVWDDCLSVPDRIVRVRRHRSISVSFHDELGRKRQWDKLPAHLSELVQHEIDHLDGILMTARAIDDQSVRPIAEHATLVGAGRPEHRLSLEAIAEAARVINPVFLNSPQYTSDTFSEAFGCSLTLKVETLNPIKSFKGRGADYFVQCLERAGDQQALVCASAGNFGQGLAHACTRHGRPLTVFASVHANPDKVQRMGELGAQVILRGEDFDAAKDEARKHCEETGSRMVEDGRDAAISEGAGSLGIELLSNGDTFDCIVLPLGNGALINGVGRWVKAASPATQVIGVTSTGADAMEASWRQDTIVQRSQVSTIADGIAVRTPIPEALEDMRDLVDEVIPVSDDNIIVAMRLLHGRANVVAEPAGAAGVAAILARPELFKDRRVATVICGSNLTDEDAQRWLQDDPVDN